MNTGHGVKLSCVPMRSHAEVLMFMKFHGFSWFLTGYYGIPVCMTKNRGNFHGFFYKEGNHVMCHDDNIINTILIITVINAVVIYYNHNMSYCLTSAMKLCICLGLFVCLSVCLSVCEHGPS